MHKDPKTRSIHPVLNMAVLVAALGYFVDIYDLVLFSIVRVPSLTALGLSGEALFEKGVLLLNMQMIGMLLGGIFWGILGDKKGRLSVLFGSILLYSLANLLNGMVQSVEAYALLRLIAGIGLAGELGAGITLVSEILPKEKRGYGTAVVASVGICGALLAAFVGERFSWRVAYYIGGALGLSLLILRVSVFESGLFQHCKNNSEIKRGAFSALFSSKARFFKYLRCILIGVPVWYVVGILITFSPEFARALGIQEPISAGKGIMYCYLGLAIGDLTSGLVSQWIQSRKKVVATSLAITFVFVVIYMRSYGVSSSTFYAICTALGFGSGYWAIFVTIGAEQFGTNLRATVATTVPNFVRGAVVPLTFMFTLAKGVLGIVPGGFAVGVIALGVAALSVWGMEESFHKDLDYLEELP